MYVPGRRLTSPRRRETRLELRPMGCFASVRVVVRYRRRGKKKSHMISVRTKPYLGESSINIREHKISSLPCAGSSTAAAAFHAVDVYAMCHLLWVLTPPFTGQRRGTDTVM